MRILLLTHSFNRLAQSLYVALARCGHSLAVELDIDDSITIESVSLFAPELVIAPYMKRRIPEAVWSRCPCLIVHPGIPGDGGASALDWAMLDNQKTWGVTVFQANEALDGGPIWSWSGFDMREATKSSLYGEEVTRGAVTAVLDAINKITGGKSAFTVNQIAGLKPGRWRNPVRHRDREINWQEDDTGTVLRKIHSADGHPGLLDEMAGMPCRLYDAHPEAILSGKPGSLVARRGEAVCRATIDGAVWIGRLKAKGGVKLPATMVLGNRVNHLPEILLPFHAVPQDESWQDITYREAGAVGYLGFDFYNGAMSTRQCRRLRLALAYAKKRPTRIIVLTGGDSYWSNGIDLNSIEAAESAADESWRNINAMDDLCAEIIQTTTHLTVAALSGNAAAGGCFLALATDLVMAREGTVLSPHYRNMGNLYGSEYWTYLLPCRVKAGAIKDLLSNRLPMGADEALACGLVDDVGASDPYQFKQEVADRVLRLAQSNNYAQLISDKQRIREEDEKVKPLEQYRKEELEKMRLNFYGFDPSYHVARYRFVHHTPHAWTPLYLAPHRRLDWHAMTTDSSG